MTNQINEQMLQRAAMAYRRIAEREHQACSERDLMRAILEAALPAVAASGSAPQTEEQEEHDIRVFYEGEMHQIEGICVLFGVEDWLALVELADSLKEKRASSGSTGAPTLDQPTPLVPLDGFMGDEQHFRLEKSKVTAHTERDERVYLDPWPNGSVHLFTDELLALAHTLARSGPLDQPGAASTGGAPTLQELAVKWNALPQGGFRWTPTAQKHIHDFARWASSGSTGALDGNHDAH